MRSLLFFALAVYGTSSLKAETPPLESVFIQKFLAPAGYDDNDVSVLIQIMGTLPSTCHYIGPAEVYKAGQHVDIRQYAYRYAGTKEFCLQMKIPYTATINLGPLQKVGDWEVRLADTSQMLGKIHVDEAPSPRENPDSYTYALVEDAWTQQNPLTKRWEAKLKLHFRNKCTKLSKVEVDVQAAQETVLIRPIVDNGLTLDPANCPEQSVRLDHTEVLPASLKGAWLLHVRAANGQAISKLSLLE
jgi:hypothetical protein